MAVAGKTPTASFLTKIGKMQSAGCRLCKIARGARGESIDGLADETHGHINSAGCEGMATIVTAAHHSIWIHLYDSMHAAQKPKSKLKFVRTLGTVCTCEEIERGTHACRTSQLGPVQRWWTQDGKLGITIQDPPAESRRRTHLLYFTYSYCILSHV